MKTVAAFDLSLAGTGAIVLGEAGTILHRETIETTTKTPHRQRLIQIADTIVSIVDRYQPVAILKEAPAHGARFGVHALGEVHGVVDYAMEKAAQPLLLSVNPKTLKKFATGRGLGEKGDIKMWIVEKWHEKFSDNNQSDAYVMARIGGIIAGFFKMTSKHEAECVKTVLASSGRDEEAKKIKLSSFKNDMRVCGCGRKMKTGIEMEMGKCAQCIDKDRATIIEEAARP